MACTSPASTQLKNTQNNNRHEEVRARSKDLPIQIGHSDWEENGDVYQRQTTQEPYLQIGDCLKAFGGAQHDGANPDQYA